MLRVGGTLGGGLCSCCGWVGPWGRVLPMLPVGGTLREECCLSCGYVGAPRGEGAVHAAGPGTHPAPTQTFHARPCAAVLTCSGTHPAPLPLSAGIHTSVYRGRRDAGQRERQLPHVGGAGGSGKHQQRQRRDGLQQRRWGRRGGGCILRGALQCRQQGQRGQPGQRERQGKWEWQVEWGQQGKWVQQGEWEWQGAGRQQWRSSGVRVWRAARGSRRDAVSIPAPS